MTGATDEPITWNCEWGVRKYDEDAVEHLTRKLGRTPLEADFAAARIDPYEDNRIERNLVTTLGWDRITKLIIGTAVQAADNTHTRIGVGNGAGTAAVGDTDLSAAAGSANRWFRVMDASFPTQANGVMTFQATFPSADGNFAWNEFGIDISTSAATSGATVGTLLLNHKTSIAQGTKTSGQSWTASATVTLT